MHVSENQKTEGGAETEMDRGIETESEDEQTELWTECTEEACRRWKWRRQESSRRRRKKIENEAVITLKRNRTQISRTRLVSIAVVTETFYDVVNGLQKRGTVRTTTAYPSINGLAEQFMQSLKSSLSSMRRDKRNTQTQSVAVFDGI